MYDTMPSKVFALSFTHQVEVVYNSETNTITSHVQGKRQKKVNGGFKKRRRVRSQREREETVHRLAREERRLRVYWIVYGGLLVWLVVLFIQSIVTLAQM